MIPCPACSNGRGNKTDAKFVTTCKKCQAIFADTLYLGDSYSYVLPFWSPEVNCAPESLRYFDLTCVGSKGVERRHGWYNTADKKIVQVG